MRRVTVLRAYVLLHGSRSEYGLWLPHINLGLGKTNDGSDTVRDATVSRLVTAPNSFDSGRGRLQFQLTAAFHGYGDEGPGMQPGRAEASPINPNKLVSSSARTLCKSFPLSPSLSFRIVTVAVKPDTSGTPAGT